jgi:membrane-bound lytic murein transglycosylase B
LRAWKKRGMVGAGAIAGAALERVRRRIERHGVLLALSAGLAVSLAVPAAASATTRPDFDEWLSGVRSEALEKGISPATLDAALADLEPAPRILEADRSQPRKPQDLCGYMDRRLTSTRIARARKMLVQHRELLAEISAEYGVPPRYLVSLWGLESNFGDYQGDHSVVQSLATLAWDPRRGKTFRGQLFSALQILEEGQVDLDSVEDMTGSWAGAMGQVQFMPSTYLAYAVDHDGDGRKDIWGSVPDALASAANYLDEAGWRAGETWGRRVEIPPDMETEGRTSRRRKLDDWGRLGVRSYGGEALPVSNMSASLVLPADRPKPAFLVYHNYRTLLAWNRSTFFGISVGSLADLAAGRSAPRICSP